jgi:hypothetical protein
MNTLTKVRVTIFACLFGAQAMAADQGGVAKWYLYDQGVCQEKTPLEFVLLAKTSGLKAYTKDHSENGQVVSTDVTVVDERTYKRDVFHFYRGKERCSKAMVKDLKRLEDMFNRYQ